MFGKCLSWQRLRVGVCACIWACVPAIAHARTSAMADVPGWVVDRYSVADGLPTNLVTGVAQEPSGGIWVSTFDGLARVDGSTVETVRRSDAAALPGNRFVAIRADSSGGLFALEELGGVARLGPVGWQVVPAMAWSFLLAGAWCSYLETATGTWHVGPGGVYRDRKRIAAIGGQIRQLVEDSSGAIWVTSEHEGLFRIHRAIVAAARLPDGIDSNMEVVARSSDGGLWAINHAGLLLRGRDGQAWATAALHLPMQLSPVQPLEQPQALWPDWNRADLVATSLLMGPEGGVWIGTDSGVARWGPSEIQPVPFLPRVGVQTWVESMFIDSAERFWVATPAGLLVAQAADVLKSVGLPAADPRWRWVPGPNGQAIPFAHTFVETAHGELFVTTRQQGLARIIGGKIELLTQIDGLASDRLRGLLQTDATTLWVGSQDAGLCRVQFRRGEPLKTAGYAASAAHRACSTTASTPSPATQKTACG